MTERVYPYRMKVGYIPPEYDYYPFKRGDIVTLLGEISNMPGHFVVVLSDGVIRNCHDDFFVEIP